MLIRKYENFDFDQLCHVMDRARMQELLTASVYPIEKCTVFRIFVKEQNLCRN